MFYKFLLILANITGDTNDNTNNEETSSEKNKKMAELPKELAKLKILAAATTTETETPEEDVVTSFTGLKKKAKVQKKDKKGATSGEEVIDYAKEIIELTMGAEVISFFFF